MKIELSELPTLRALFEELQQNAWTAHQLSRPQVHPSEFRVEDREHNEMHIISHAELLGIFQARVEAQTKHLRQRYQIDFIPAATQTALDVAAAPPAAPVLDFETFREGGETPRSLGA